jgi:hypothetical protein
MSKDETLPAPPPPGLEVPLQIVRDTLRKYEQFPTHKDLPEAEAIRTKLRTMIEDANTHHETMVFVKKDDADMLKILGLVHAAELVEGYAPRDNTAEFLGDTMRQFGQEPAKPDETSPAAQFRRMVRARQTGSGGAGGPLGG